jgi:hypothetical protein
MCFEIFSIGYSSELSYLSRKYHSWTEVFLSVGKPKCRENYNDYNAVDFIASVLHMESGEVLTAQGHKATGQEHACQWLHAAWSFHREFQMLSFRNVAGECYFGIQCLVLRGHRDVSESYTSNQKMEAVC